MLARLRENLSFKLLALAGAILLHLYVANQLNPSQTRSVTVPISVKDVPEGLLMPAKPGNVMVSLTGSNEELSRIADMNVTATVDLRHGRSGENGGLPVDVELSPSGLRASVTVSEFKPHTVSIDLVERRRRRMPISVEVSGTSAAGFILRKPSLLVPSMATATGAADDIDSIAKLVVKPDVTGATDTVDDDYQIVPVDSQGADIANIQIEPDTAHVQIGVVEAGRTKEVFITPKITGQPAPGFVVGTVVTKPATAILSGGIDQLAAALNAATEPVDIQGANANVTRQVRCIAPTGSTLTSPSVISVSIQIIPVAPVQTPPLPSSTTVAPAAPAAAAH